MNYELNKFVVILRWFILKWNLCSFAWSKEPKIKAVGLFLKRKLSIFLIHSRSEALYFVHSWNADFVGDLLRSFRQKSSISVRSQNPTIPMPEGLSELGDTISKWNWFVVILKWNLCSFPWFYEAIGRRY